MKSSYWRLATAVVGLCLFCYPARLPAQTETGSLRGMVTDESGGLIGGARVVCREMRTGVSRETITSDQGSYEIPYLQPGTYRVSVSKANFKESVAPAFELHVNQTARLDVRLQLGGVTEQLSVTAETAALQSETSVVGGQVEQKSLVELPGRDLITLIGLGTSTAQLSMAGYGSNSLTPLQPGRGSIAVNLNLGGYRQTGNYYMLDGVSNTDWNINAMVTVPSAESLQELRVQTSTNSAAFGQVPGGTVNIVTRAGGNSWHGQAYDYLRNEKLDALPYNFNPGVLPKLPFKSNQFGGSLGGAIQIPHLYQGRNRSFFFAHYEGTIQRSASQGIATVPTAAARGGQLAEYGRTLYDPLSLQDGLRSPFPGATIPQNRLDAAALKVIGLTPAPNRSGISNNLNISRAAPEDRHQGNLRLDHMLGAKDFLTGSYHAGNVVSSQDSAIGSVTGTRTNLYSENASVNGTHVFGAGLLTNLKFGFNRLNAVDRVYGTQDFVALLGIQGLNHDTVNWGLPSFQTGSVSVATDGPNRPTAQRDNLFQLINDWTVTKGKHRLELGGEYRRAQLNFQLSNPSRGQFRFTGAFTNGPDPNRPAANTGIELADFLMGDPLSASRVLGTPLGYIRSSYVAGYAGDTIRMTSHLTMILGLRYDYSAPPSETRDHFYSLDFSTLPAAPKLVRLGVDASSLPAHGVRRNPADFSPRVGLAYQAGAHTVLRTAYGIYRVQEIGAIYYDMVRNGVTTEVNNSSVATPQLSLTNAFGNGAPSTPSYFYVSPNSRTPYVQQWNAGVQRTLPFSSVLEVIYAGTKGTRLYRFRSLNTAFQTETGANLPPRPGVLQQLRTFPTLGAITGIEAGASSTYHSLQVRLDKRLSHGVSWIQSFTWSKSIDDSGLPLQDFYQNAGAQDERNLRAEKGLSEFDVRKRMTSAVLWTLPFGKGRQYLRQGVAGWLAGPWQVSSLLVAQDGYPQNILNFAGLSTFGTLQRVNMVAGQHLVYTPEERAKLTPTAANPRPDLQYYNPAAITVPGTFELGNAGRDIGPSPGAVRVDLSVLRTFDIRERGRISFRMDMVNAFNIVNYGIPSTGPTSFNFGQLTTVGAMRTVTASLKCEF